MSPAFTLSAKSCDANALNVCIGAWGCDAPSRTFLISSCRSVNASIASRACVVNFTSLSLPVRGSTGRARHRNPPSFLFQTPGLLGRCAIHDLHLRTHFVSVIGASTREGTEASGRESTSAEERVEGFAAPRPRATAVPAAFGRDAALAHGLPERA